MELKRFKTRELKGANRCNMRRSRNIHLESGKKQEGVYEKAALIKELIKESVKNNFFDEADVKEKIDTFFLHADYPTEATAMAHAKDAFRQVKRYATCELMETRTKIVFLPEKTFEMFGLCEVDVRPDFIFYGTRPFKRKVLNEKGRPVTMEFEEPYMEAVKLCCSKPNVTQSGRNKDTGVNQSLELYSLLCYARSMITSGDEDINVGASYYFLRKKK